MDSGTPHKAIVMTDPGKVGAGYGVSKERAINESAHKAKTL